MSEKALENYLEHFCSSLIEAPGKYAFPQYRKSAPYLEHFCSSLIEAY